MCMNSICKQTILVVHTMACIVSFRMDDNVQNTDFVCYVAACTNSSNVNDVHNNLPGANFEILEILFQALRA